MDEICPPGNTALREIRGFIERGIAEELVIAVVRDAVLSGARSPKYVIAILERCEAEGITTVASFRYDAQKKKKSAPAYRRGYPGQRGMITAGRSQMTQDERDTLKRYNERYEEMHK